MNEKIKSKAQELYPIESKAECHVAFIQGASMVGWMPIPKGDDDYPTDEFEEELKNSVPFILYNHKWDSYFVAFDDISLGHTIDKLRWHHSEFDLWYKIPKAK